MSSGTLQSVSIGFPGEMAPGSLYQPSTGGTMNDAATAPTIVPTIMKTTTLCMPISLLGTDIYTNAARG